jgi:hypothetical protein
MEELGIGRSTAEHELGGAPGAVAAGKRTSQLYLGLSWLSKGVQRVEEVVAEVLARFNCDAEGAELRTVELAVARWRAEEEG